MNDARKLAERIARIEHQVRDLQTVASLADSSVEDGTLDFYDEAGLVRLVMGKQADGTWHIGAQNGPTPPMPSTPTVVAISGAANVTWDGKTADGSAWPADFERVEVHVSTASGFTPDETTEWHAFHSVTGGTVSLALAPGAHYVRLLSVNTSFIKSDPTPEVSVTSDPLVTLDELNTTADGKNAIHRETFPPTTEPNIEGDLWWEVDANGRVIGQWVGAGGTTWVQQTIDGAVLANIDAGTITVGQLSGAHIEAGTIAAGALAANAVQAGDIAAGAVQAGTLDVGAVQAGNIDVGAVTADTLDVGAVTATAIAAGAIGAVAIAADSITVDKLMVGDLLDLVRDPDMAGIGTWDPAAGWAITDVSATPAPHSATGKALRFTAFSTYSQTEDSRPFPCHEGESFHLDFYSRHTGADPTSGSIGCYVFFYDASGTLTTVSGADTNIASYTGTDWLHTTQEITVPAGSASARIVIRATAGLDAGLWDFAQVHLYRKVTGDLLVNGAIDGQTITGPVIQTVDGVGPGVQGMQISADTAGGVVKFWSGVAGESAGYVNPVVLAPDTPRIDMSSGSTPTKPEAATIHLDAGTVAGGGVASGSRSVSIGGALSVSSQILGQDEIHSFANGIYMDDLNGGGHTGADIGNGGRIVRTTSSRRYKYAVRAMKKAEAYAVLAAQAVTFKRKKLRPEDPADSKRYPGFIAEDMADAGAELWVNRDSAGRPDGVRYAEVTAAHHVIIQDLLDRIEVLEARIAEQEK